MPCLRTTFMKEFCFFSLDHDGTFGCIRGDRKSHRLEGNRFWQRDWTGWNKAGFAIMPAIPDTTSRSLFRAWCNLSCCHVIHRFLNVVSIDNVGKKRLQDRTSTKGNYSLYYLINLSNYPYYRHLTRRCWLHCGSWSCLIVHALPFWPSPTRASISYCNLCLCLCARLGRLMRGCFVFQRTVRGLCLCHCVPTTPIGALLWQIQYLWIGDIILSWTGTETAM